MIKYFHIAKGGILTELKIKELPVSEKNYAETMKTKVEPYLASLREDGYFESFDGKRIHFEKYVVPESTANITVVHGFTESGEKFREMAYNFTLMGFNVFVIDNRGHGKSYRMNADPETVTIDRFDTYVEDLHEFVKQIVIPANEGKPMYVYCHSMGGAVTVQYLQEHPGVFKKAVLSAPMIKCRCGKFSQEVALALTSAFCLLGKKDDMVIGYKGFNPDRTYENSHDTSKARFDYYQAKRVADRDYQTASPSNKWVTEAVKVTKKNLDKKRCKNISIPVFLCQPEEDTSVYSDAENEFISLIPDGKLKQYKNCKHEIYAAVDDTVFEYLQDIEKFYKA